MRVRARACAVCACGSGGGVLGEAGPAWGEFSPQPPLVPRSVRPCCPARSAPGVWDTVGRNSGGQGGAQWRFTPSNATGLREEHPPTPRLPPLSTLPDPEACPTSPVIHHLVSGEEISAFRRQFAGLRRRRGGSEAQGWGRGRGRAHRLIQPAPSPSGPPGVRAGAHVPGALPRQLPDYTQGRAHQAPGEQRQGEDAVSLGAARPESRTLRPKGGPRRHPRGRFAAQQCQWPRAAVTSGAGGLTGSRAEALVPAWMRRM